MSELELVDIIYNKLKQIKINGRHLFKQIIKNNILPPDMIKIYPSISFYIANTEYKSSKNYNIVGVEVIAYSYNRHTTEGLSTNDIDSKLIYEVRSSINNIKNNYNNITESFVSKTARDGGVLFPRTVVEYVINIEFIESNECK